MTIQTGIFKEPVSYPVAIRDLNLVGDGQADLTVHIGAEKAVYRYPAAHYEYWRKRLLDDAPYLNVTKLLAGDYGRWSISIRNDALNCSPGAITRRASPEHSAFVGAVIGSMAIKSLSFGAKSCANGKPLVNSIAME